MFKFFRKSDLKYNLEFIKEIPMPLFILEPKSYEILFANKKATLLSRGRWATFEGNQIGEFLNCRTKKSYVKRCTESPLCQYCGICKSLKGNLTQEVDFLTEDGTHTFLATSIQSTFKGKPCLCLFLEDLTEKKDYSALERSFFHDLMNRLQCLIGFPTLLDKGEGSISKLKEVLESIIEEVSVFREVRLAESNSPTSGRKVEVSVKELIKEVISEFHSLKTNPKGIKILTSVPEVDETILVRVDILREVLKDLVKNAIEATEEYVTIEYNSAMFTIHNQEMIPLNTQAKIFKKFYSSKKGAYKGASLYASKILVSRVLDGELNFKSSKEDGTSFFLNLEKF